MLTVTGTVDLADGAGEASTVNAGIDAPSLKGGTGIGELGVTVKPSAEMKLMPANARV